MYLLLTGRTKICGTGSSLTVSSLLVFLEVMDCKDLIQSRGRKLLRLCRRLRTESRSVGTARGSSFKELSVFRMSVSVPLAMDRFTFFFSRLDGLLWEVVAVPTGDDCCAEMNCKHLMSFGVTLTGVVDLCGCDNDFGGVCNGSLKYDGRLDVNCSGSCGGVLISATDDCKSSVKIYCSAASSSHLSLQILSMNSLML